MTTYNTGNPLGSTSPKDLYDNAENLDHAVNSDGDTFQDRFGKSRLTWAGIVKAGSGDPAIAVDAAARAEAAASSVEQNAEQIAQDAAQQAVQDVIGGVDGQVAVAQSAADRAEGAADRAETARDAAFVNADVYLDIASGLADVADGEQFQVVEGDEIVRYRRDSASTQTEMARYPSAQVVERNLLDITKLAGGQVALAAENAFSIRGYISAEGVLVDDGAYKTTGFIPVQAGRIISATSMVSSTAAKIAFYDGGQNFISSLAVNDTEPTTREIAAPDGAIFARFTNNFSAFTDPSAVMFFDGIVIDEGLLGESDLTLLPADNLASEDRLIYDKFIKADGAIASESGWVMLGLNVTPEETYTFGRFSIDVGGYWAFHDSSGTVISTSSYSTSRLPVTVTAPMGAAVLYFDVARPANTSSDWTKLTLNAGTMLLPYEDPEPVITRIKNFRVGSRDEAPQGVADRLALLNSAKPYFVSRRKPIFSFIWDDLNESDALVYSVFQDYGFVPSFALTGNKVNEASIARYQNYYLSGCSILAHSMTHPDMRNSSTLTAEQARQQMRDSKAVIEQYGIRVSGWVTPFSVLKQEWLPLVEQQFGYGFTASGGSFDETVDPIQMSRISLEGVDQSVADVKLIIDDAILNQKLIFFYGHQLPSPRVDSDGVTSRLTEADLKEILAYLKERHEAGDCLVLGADEALYQYYKAPLLA